MKIIAAILTLFILVFTVFSWEVYFPLDVNSTKDIEFLVRRGEGDEEISKNLKEQGIIRSDYFFRFYAIISGNDSKLQAGRYSLSPKMAISKIIRKLVLGDVIKQNITIIEGWSVKDIEKYLAEKEILSAEDFQEALIRDYSSEFDFLAQMPKGASIEGYLFPDTYRISLAEKAENIIKIMLLNFGQKLDDDLKKQIALQKKTIFDVITMASIIEKEVKTTEDKKIVSGILWKRLGVGMPLQVDATVNYITGKNQPRVFIEDTKIDSPYNTYKYKGLPKGPISNPGINSILAAIYPTESKYWYYLSGFDGKTIFSETFAEHNIAKAKYFKK